MAAPKPVQMACLNIGYEHYLLPAPQAMKVMELMQGAVKSEIDFGAAGRGETLYVANGQPRLELKFIHPNQVRIPEGTDMPGARVPKARRLTGA